MGNESFTAKIFVFVVGLSGFQAYGAIIAVLFICGLGVPIPEDVTLFAAGFLAFKGRISLTGAFVVGFVGVLIGDSLLFMIGRLFGRRVFSWPFFRRLFTPERIEMATLKIQERGKIICFTSRFIPGLRAPIYLTSGVMRIPFITFITMDGLAAAISVPVWVYMAYHFGDKVELLFQIAKRTNIGIGLVLALFFLFILFKYIRKRRKSRQN